MFVTYPCQVLRTPTYYHTGSHSLILLFLLIHFFLISVKVLFPFSSEYTIHFYLKLNSLESHCIVCMHNIKNWHEIIVVVVFWIILYILKMFLNNFADN